MIFSDQDATLLCGKRQLIGIINAPIGTPRVQRRQQIDPTRSQLLRDGRTQMAARICSSKK